MPPVRVIATRSDSAADPAAEFWVGEDRMAVTLVYDGRLHLRIEPRPDGEPWVMEAASLALALESAADQMADY